MADKRSKRRVLLTVEAIVQRECDRTLDDPDYHEYVFVGGTEVRDRLGRRNPKGYTTWLRVPCNNGECPGWAIVSERTIGDALEAS